MAKFPKMVEAEFLPLCPHCNEVLHSIAVIKKGIGMFGQHTTYACPYCKKLLSMSHAMVR